MLVLPGFRSSRSRLSPQEANQAVLRKNLWMIKAYHTTYQARPGKSMEFPIETWASKNTVIENRNIIFLKNSAGFCIHQDWEIDFFGRPNLQIQVINVIYLDRN